MTSQILTFILLGFVLTCSIGNIESASTTQRSSGSSKVSSIIFRPFRLVKISTLSKRTLPIQQTRSTLSERPKNGSNTTASTTSVSWKSFFTLIKPPKKVSTTTMKPTTTAATTPTIATTKVTPKTKTLTINEACLDICQRDRYTNRYVITACKGYINAGKYRLCVICRYKRKICKKLGSTGLIN